LDIAHREERGQWKEMQTIHRHIDTLLNEKYQCKRGNSQFKQEDYLPCTEYAGKA